ncbi:hypothetical protein [Gilliamella sp. ESL0232]|uniref:hypothetical protein n=1 Tax=Gilliamella sp. ESL0232 TaxID=2705037 RepID=UPI001EECC79C|nr:hypothetical protein [Gilliamella sp. ESL0232]
MLLLSSLWSLQALPVKNGRRINRSDAIILPSSQWGEVMYAIPRSLEYGLPIPGIWDSDYGFLIQSTNPESYALNFPTTGANELYFYLAIRGDADELTWEPVTHEGISATMSYAYAGENYFTRERCKIYVCVKVRLTGPEAVSQWRNPYPNRIAKPRLPQTFEIIGRDREGNEVIKYGFVLQKWFAFRADYRYYPEGEKTFQIQESWCSSLGYRMANINEVTNAVCIDRANGGASYNQCRGNVVSAIPSSLWWVRDRRINKHDRRIGAGLLTEWGYLSFYGASVPPDWYWARGPAENSVYAYDVNLAAGEIGILWKGNDRGAMCVTP